MRLNGRLSAARYRAAKELIDAGIECTLVLDSAVAFAMERVDLVLCGAEGVVENGGIVNLVVREWRLAHAESETVCAHVCEFLLFA